MNQVFAEVTMLSHGHGGAGWELGTCLWSPTTTSSGQDRYAIMREPDVGDVIFHWVAGVIPSAPRRRFLWGRSIVTAPAIETDVQPPMAGVWAGRAAYYRIDLGDFQRLEPAPNMDPIESELSELILRDVLGNRPKHYPYVRYQEGFRIAQGIYLTRLSPTLAEALDSVFQVAASNEPAAAASETIAREFNEGERFRQEVTLFRRNPGLRKAAIEHHGLQCAVCRFDFGRIYGALGEGYIEIHHLSPLHERTSIIAGRPIHTTVDDVIPLCANCHRMAHRERPAVSLDRLRSLMRTPLPTDT